MRKSKAIIAVLAAGTAVLAAGCGSSPSGGSSGSGASSVDWSKVTSLTATGKTDMANLIKAAEKEGQLNVITLPSNWANYGTIMTDFSKLYHIHISDAIPEGSSGQEITAVQTEKGQSRAPDVVDVGTPFAVEGATDGLWAPYEVQTWSN
ncbi:MAG TPA: ABC transporter substrate-binding protein, partial [Streptosporangiaceae bacterium]|nr:ABC transporter substrate-binding protein [Streptosporangiaceae bacterium]